MIIIEILLLVLIMLICIRTAYTDNKTGLILNRDLLIFAIPGVVLNVIYYTAFVNDILIEYIINVCIVIIVGLILFYSKSLAGGDVKLLILIGLIYPARMYVVYVENNITLIFALGIAIFLGYVYLLIDAIVGIAKNPTKISKKYVKNYLIAFLKSFIRATLYIGLISYLLSLLSIFGISIGAWISRIICIAIALLIGRYKIFSSKWLMGIIILLDLLGLILFRQLPVSTNIGNYIIVIVLLLCQMTIKTNIYREIKISELEKGMILSTVSSLLMQNSRVRGLPRISEENLGDRLTEEQIASITRWAESRDVEWLTIVKKIPFAIFISLGYITYFVLWRIFA